MFKYSSIGISVFTFLDLRDVFLICRRMLSLAAVRYRPEDLEKNKSVKEAPKRDVQETLTSKDEVQYKKLFNQSTITITTPVCTK
jgi:hypothetical protein